MLPTTLVKLSLEIAIAKFIIALCLNYLIKNQKIHQTELFYIFELY